MPLFEYSCRQCGERFESLVRRADVDRTVCPECGSKRVQRQLSTFAAAVAAPASGPACGDRACGPGGCPGGACPYSAS